MMTKTMEVPVELVERLLELIDRNISFSNRPEDDLRELLDAKLAKRDLASCPCCGESASVEELKGSPIGVEYYVLCDGCMLQTTTYPEEHMAVEAWNKRSGSLHPIIQTLHNNGDLIALEATVAQQAEYIRLLEAEKAKGWSK